MQLNQPLKVHVQNLHRTFFCLDIVTLVIERLQCSVFSHAFKCCQQSCLWYCSCLAFSTFSLQTVCPDSYTPYNSFQMSYIFGLGVRVQRGPDWLSSYGNADGGIGSLGTVVQKLGTQSTGYASVLWDNGASGLYRVNIRGSFDICRFNGMLFFCSVLMLVFLFVWNYYRCWKKSRSAFVVVNHIHSIHLF